MKNLRRMTVGLLFALLLMSGMCVHARTQKIDAAFYTVKLSASMQKKYKPIFTDYAASHYLIFYDAKAWKKGTRVEKFRFTCSMDFPLAGSSGLEIKGKITPAWICGGIFGIMYPSDRIPSKTVIRNAEAIYKTVKMKKGYKFTPFKAKSFTAARKALYNFLITRTIDGETFPITETFSGVNLIYLDNNRTPEILLVSDTVYGGEVLISYYKGKLIVNRLEYGSVKYWKNKNRLYLEAGRMGYYSNTIYKLSKGVLKPVKEGTWESADATMDHAVNCKWNGVSVSLSQYRNYLKKALPSKKASRPSNKKDVYPALDKLLFG